MIFYFIIFSVIVGGKTNSPGSFSAASAQQNHWEQDFVHLFSQQTFTEPYCPSFLTLLVLNTEDTQIPGDLLDSTLKSEITKQAVWEGDGDYESREFIHSFMHACMPKAILEKQRSRALKMEKKKTVKFSTEGK